MDTSRKRATIKEAGLCLGKERGPNIHPEVWSESKDLGTYSFSIQGQKMDAPAEQRAVGPSSACLSVVWCPPTLVKVECI